MWIVVIAGLTVYLELQAYAHHRLSAAPSAGQAGKAATKVRVRPAGCLHDILQLAFGISRITLAARRIRL